MTAALDALPPEARARLAPLLARQWSPPGEHPLAALDGQPLDDCWLIVLLGPRNNVGSRYFQLFLAGPDGELARDPLALGLHNSGPFPAYNWLELIRYDCFPSFGGRPLDLATRSLDLPLFRMLSGLAPPGGHMMVEYDSPGQRATERVLTLGYPPVTSPTGYLMFQAGCRSYRDWYISEGGREGPRKLQGFQPLNDDIRREREQKLREQLQALLSSPENLEHGEWGALARRLAARVREALG